MSEYLKAKNAISGGAGEATVTIDGRVYNLFSAKKINAKVSKSKADIKVIGARGVQKKAAGFSGSGTLSLYDVSSVFRKLMIDYMDRGKDFYFDLTVRSYDESSDYGAQTVTLYDCNLDEVTLAQLDADADALEAEYPFTFARAAMSEEYTNSDI